MSGCIFHCWICARSQKTSCFPVAFTFACEGSLSARKEHQDRNTQHEMDRKHHLARWVTAMRRSPIFLLRFRMDAIVGRSTGKPNPLEGGALRARQHEDGGLAIHQAQPAVGKPWVRGIGVQHTHGTAGGTPLELT